MSHLHNARQLEPELIRLRHALHQEPEIGLDLPRTQERVLSELEDLPLEITLGRQLSSIGGVLRGTADAAGTHTSDRPVVLLRGDMDGLPVQERTNVQYSSRIDGAMHACGHDLHTAMLAGAARLLAERQSQLPGDVVFMFQPGEEGCNGAGIMIDEGILDLAGRRVDAAFGMHVFSGQTDHGNFLTRPGIMMSASDTLIVTVQGTGGHGSAPYKAQDPIAVVTEMISALQVAVTRQFDIFDPVVITVGLLRAGTASNIIPDSAYFEASVRTFSEASRDRLKRLAPQLLGGIARAHGLDADVEFRPRYPATVNNDAEAQVVMDTAAELFGTERIIQMKQPLAASEDFSRVLNQVPGAFVGLGAAAPGVDPNSVQFNHSPFASFDDGVLAEGAALYAQLAENRLQQLAHERRVVATAVEVHQ
ncbi:M20 metallopeptidase family protein [Paeniglutamicibacter terrestris]|uniref:Amidohydrolase n=1 Tax=Paeniglutamicibacter terrestris TaxID=2723403 RepID=A0ABX1G0Y6_9MICC|nr:M20 family metallopeptidase [Paeniglutamicibacter terrestris]NKG19902.1 amidohydrolase [Paeniglutamicibacter terrestris]